MAHTRLVNMHYTVIKNVLTILLKLKYHTVKTNYGTVLKS